MATKICVGNYVGDIYHQNFIQIGLGFRLCAFVISPPSAQSDSANFFWFFRKATAETLAPILCAVPRKEVYFGGRKNKI